MIVNMYKKRARVSITYLKNKNERENSKTIFSDVRGVKTLDIVFMIEKGKNKCSQINRVNITMLT